MYSQAQKDSLGMTSQEEWCSTYKLLNNKSTSFKTAPSSFNKNLRISWWIPQTLEIIPQYDFPSTWVSVTKSLNTKFTTIIRNIRKLIIVSYVPYNFYANVMPKVMSSYKVMSVLLYRFQNYYLKFSHTLIVFLIISLSEECRIFQDFSIVAQKKEI